MSKNKTILDSFAQWWFGDISNKDHSTKKKRRKKRGKTNK